MGCRYLHASVKLPAGWVWWCLPEGHWVKGDAGGCRVLRIGKELVTSRGYATHHEAAAWCWATVERWRKEDQARELQQASLF